MNYTIKDSGNREHFDTGSVRDTNEGKPRYDLISPYALTRLAKHMARGAKKYGERNRERGQPIERFYESALRHLMQYRMGDKEEDHLSAAIYNLHAIIHFEETSE